MAAVLGILALICALASLAGVIMLLVAAFQDEVLQGFLVLCVPFYSLFYAFAKLQSDKKGLIIGLWLGGGVAYGILTVAAAMAGPVQIGP